MAPYELTRRNLLRAGGYAGAATLAATALPQSAHGLAQTINRFTNGRSTINLAGPGIDDPAIKALALRAIDAAKSAGATYADVRLTRTELQVLGSPLETWQWTDSEELAIGVRALVNGYWGFAASAIWTNDEAARLAQDAVAQAKTNAHGTPRAVELGTIPVVTGSWTMPVKRDPFTVSLEERGDFFTSWFNLASEYSSRFTLKVIYGAFIRQGRALATSDGSYVTQTVYNTSGSAKIYVKDADWRMRGRVSMQARGLSGAGKGWELFLDADPHGQIPEMMEEAEALLRAPQKPVELGRHDLIISAPVVAELVDQTIGVATELDRALGYEANAGGTSYLSKPLSMLGSYKIGSPLLTVTGNRTASGGLSTVKWDNEAVAPSEMTLVREGIAHDFQTTREQAAWLAPWYQQQQGPVRSNGCASADSALSITMQHSPNLALRPGSQQTTFEEMIAGTSKGIAVVEGSVQTDFQARTGIIGGRDSVFREINNGKLGAVLGNAEAWFSTSELWSNITAIGGSASAESFGMTRQKGQPAQTLNHSVSAVPIAVKDIAIADGKRKA